MSGHDPLRALELAKDGGKRQTLYGEERGVNGFDVMKKFGLDAGWRKASGELGTMAEGRDPSQHFVRRIEQVERRRLQGKQFADLPEGFVERIAQVERLIERGRNGVEYQQFAIAAADLLFGALALGDIEHESLIGNNVA